MKKNLIARIFLLGLFLLTIILFSYFNQTNKDLVSNVVFKEKQQPDPLTITAMREKSYPESDIKIEEVLPDGSNYHQYITSYKSDGLKIYALLTIPVGDPSVNSGQLKPANGWPVIVFNHGYIPPADYRTTERYGAYTDAFARSGYIVFRADYRGHGNSDGNPEGAYYSPAYTVDVLNAVASIKKYKDANPAKIGMWGHSMGGSITLRSMVTTKDIKAGVIWAGVVASYEDMAKNWRRSRPWMPSEREQAFRRPGRQALIEKYGSPEENPQFWKSIAPISYVKDISGPVQIHHGEADEEVPLLFSKKLNDAMRDAGKTVEFYTYSGDNHNISNNLDTALQRSVDFFDKYLKTK